MPRWLNGSLAVVAIALAPILLLARMQRFSDGPSYVRAGAVGAVAVVLLGVVFVVSRRYGNPER